LLIDIVPQVKYNCQTIFNYCKKKPRGEHGFKREQSAEQANQAII
jgi:hypothetical protein